MFKSCVFAAMAAIGFAFAAPSSAEARVGVFVGSRGGVAVTAGRPYYGGLAYRAAVYPVVTTSNVYPTTYVYPTSASLHTNYPVTTYAYPLPLYNSRGVFIGSPGGVVYGRHGVVGWR